MSHAPTARRIAYGQLACVVIGMLLLAQLWRDTRSDTVLWLFVVAGAAALLTAIGVRTSGRDHRARQALTKRVAEEREYNAMLEQAVAERTSELADEAK